MFLQRFYDEKLAQASYLVGCSATGEAIVIDPNRDVDQYVNAAAAEKLRITHVTETHIHADFVSGLRELAAATGAKEYLSDEGDADWKYAFAAQDGACLVYHGDVFKVGNVHFEVLHTPGHTPEHICFLVTDTAGADRPMGVFTGDFLFVGDVGRPDLLEKAAGVGGTMEAAARMLFASLQSFRELPDYLQLWPGHGAGSACGKALGAVPQTTLGYEKLFNWAFRETSADAFVEEVLAGQPEPPRYFAVMKRLNKNGPRILDGFPRPQRLTPERLASVVPMPLATASAATRSLVVDVRPRAEHARARIPGTINIPLNRSFDTWAGWLVPYDRDLYLIADDAACPTCIDRAVRDLAMIGFDRIVGWFGADAIDGWRARGGQIETIEQTSPAELRALLDAGDVSVVDVRSADEWAAGHIPGVPNIPLGLLQDRLNELPKDQPVVLHCESGARSAIGASLLRSHGFRHVINLEGGFGAWSDEGNPVETEVETASKVES
jgi:hydroxyacylglutathione hydrolase